MTIKKFIILLSSLVIIIGCSDMGEPEVLQPEMKWSPGSIDFGSTTVDHEQTSLLTVSNAGEGTLDAEIVLDQDSSSFTLLSSSSFSLEAGDTSIVQVKFMPTAMASYSGTLTISSNDLANDEVMISLSGAGVAQAVPALQLSKGALAFGSIQSGSSSNQQFNITSSGTDTLVVDSIVVGNSVYSVDRSTPVSILPGNSVVVTVTFQPTSAGDYNTQVMVYSNVSTSPHQLDVTGAATDAVSYSGSVQPIWDANCTGCHGTSAGLNLGSYAQLMSGSANGAVVNAGDGANSMIVQRLKGIGGSRMPLNGSALSDASIEQVETWIDQGALDN